MQSEAYKLSGFTVIVSAMGFMLRWLQNMRIMDQETGLAESAPISWIVGGLIVIVAAVLAGFVFRLGRFEAPGEPENALAGHTPFFTAIALIPAVLLIISGAGQLLQRDIVLWPTLHRLCGAATMAGGFGAVLVATNAVKKQKQSSCRAGAVMMILFAGVWLVTAYRDAATDPVTWRFAVEILAGCVMLLAFYHSTGYFFGVPHPKWTLFFCNLGAFLCVMSAIDDHTLAQNLAYAAVAVYLIIWGFVVTENLKTKPIEPVQQGEIPED